jgi:hypothetical protein
MTIREAIMQATERLAEANVEPTSVHIELHDTQFNMLVRERMLGRVPPDNPSYMQIHTAAGYVHVYRVRMRSRDYDVVQVSLGELHSAMRELIEIEEDWSSAEDTAVVKISMATVRKCLQFRQAAESAWMLDVDQEAHELLAGQRLDDFGNMVGIMRQTGPLEVEDDPAFRKRITSILRRSPQ